MRGLLGRNRGSGRHVGRREDDGEHTLPLPWRSPPPGQAPGWWFDAVLVLAFAALTAALVWWPPLLRLDLATRDWCDAHRPRAAWVLAQGLDHVGQGGALVTVTVASALLLAWKYDTVRPILPGGAAPILSTLLIVVLKRWTARGAPHYGSVRMFSGGTAVEYPSGHVSNGLVYYWVLALLLGPFMPAVVRSLLRWVPGVLVFIGTTYLGYHWLSDSVAGYLLGLFIVRMLQRIPWLSVPLPHRLDHLRGRTRRPPPHP